MSRSFFFAALFFVLGLLLPGVAAAQTQVWLSDRRYTEGPGIRVGDFELHPGFAAEFGYDSNYFLRADSSAPNGSEGPVGSLRLRLTPSFSLSTLGAQRREDGSLPTVQFRAGVHATYDEFFPVSGPQEGKDLMSKQRNIGGVLDFNLDLFPGRVVAGSVHGAISRSIEPSNLGDTSKGFNRDAPSGGVEIAFTPGEGTFDWRLGYDFAATIFESSSFSNLTNFDHEIKTRGRWRFLPRSALTFDGRFGFISYPSSGGINAKTSSHPMRARIGYNGLVTKSIAVLVMGGWGASFYTPTPQEDFDSFIGQAEVKFLFTPSPTNDPAAASLSLSSLALGFSRDFADSFIGTYYESDRGYAKFSYFFANRFLLVLDAGVGPVRFPKIPALSEPEPWTDVRLDTSVFGEYRFAKFFGVNATVRYSDYFSSQVPGPSDGPFDALEWRDFEAFLGIRWMM